MPDPIITDPVWMVTDRACNSRHRCLRTHAVRGEFTLCGIIRRDCEWQPVSAFRDIPKCPACDAVPTGYATTNDLLRFGLTYRQVDHWSSKLSLLKPARASNRSGVDRYYPPAEVKVAMRMAVLVAAGLSPHAAHRAARNGGQLAPGVRIVVEEAA